MRSSILRIAWVAMGLCLTGCSDIMDNRMKEEARTSHKLSPHEAELVDRYRDNSQNNGDYFDATPSSQHLSHLTDLPPYGASSLGSYSGNHSDPAPGNSLFFPGMVY
jgi:hypothetical protein